MNKSLSGKNRPGGVGKFVARQRVTMQDIARAAHCSQPTVSLVLNGNDSVKISDNTKSRVIQAAQQLGYQPQTRSATFTSQAIVSDQLQLDGPIAFIVDKLASSPQNVNAVDGVMQAVKATGNIVMLAETHNDPTQESKIIQHFLDQHVTAIIYAASFTREIKVPEKLQQTDIPVFLLNCYTDSLMLPAVIPSEIAGGHIATNVLIKAGHSRIGVITGDQLMDCASDRLRGYRNALASADIPYADELIVEGDWLPGSGYEGTRQLMAMAKPPTAIFCQNDGMAVGCFEALKEMGLSIPADVSVIGYGNNEIARHVSPPLSTVNLPDFAMGRWVVEQIFHGPVGKNRHPLTKLECEPVERKSITAPREPRRLAISRVALL